MMENMLFGKQKQLFKTTKLKRVILSKAPDILEDNIQKILESINVDKQYFVKVTRNPKRFLNITTQENVCRDGEAFRSECEVIYGCCSPGEFADLFGERFSREGMIDIELPAAAIKKVVTNSDDSSKVVSLYLVIYQPNEAVLM